MADGLYLQLDVMRMPEPEEFRRLCQHRATPFPPLALLNPPKFGPEGFPDYYGDATFPVSFKLARRSFA